MDPDPEEARVYARRLDLDFLDCLDYLTQVCDRQTPFDTADLKHVSERVRAGFALKDKVRICGTLVPAHVLLEKAMLANSSSEIQFRLGRFRDRPVLSDGIRVTALGDSSLSQIEATDLKQVLSTELAQSGQNSDIFDPTQSDAVERSVFAVHQALDAIRVAAPNLRDEIEQIVTDIVIIDSSKTNAASSYQAPGVIVLKFLRPFQTWTTYLEHIPHEAAHHLLYSIFNANDVFQRGGAERFKSPLRI